MNVCYIFIYNIYLYLTIGFPICTPGNIPGGARLHPSSAGGGLCRPPLGCKGRCFPRCTLHGRWADTANTAGGIIKLIAGYAAVVINPKGLGLLKVTVYGPQGIRNLCIWNRKQKRKRKFGASKKGEMKSILRGPAIVRTFVKKNIDKMIYF